MLSIRGPFDADGTVRLCLSDLLEGVKRPDVNLTFQVSEATNQQQLGERADTNGVAVALAKLEERIAVLVVQSGYSRLVTSDDDEAFTVTQPDHILDHVLEDWYELAIPAAEDLHVLQHVLAVVALA